jgi:hypothetical protein
VLLLGAVVVADAALSAGGTAYTKRYKTVLQAEPSPDARATGELPFARQVKIVEMKGKWLRISDGPNGGWVFAGSLTDTKPAEIKGTDGNLLLASATTATAANRPLSEEANAYAARRNLGSARVDLDWLQAQCKGVTPEDVEAHLKAQKKGEYQ